MREFLLVFCAALAKEKERVEICALHNPAGPFWSGSKVGSHQGPIESVVTNIPVGAASVQDTQVVKQQDVTGLEMHPMNGRLVNGLAQIL